MNQGQSVFFIFSKAVRIVISYLDLHTMSAGNEDVQKATDTNPLDDDDNSTGESPDV